LFSIYDLSSLLFKGNPPVELCQRGEAHHPHAEGVAGQQGNVRMRSRAMCACAAGQCAHAQQGNVRMRSISLFLKYAHHPHAEGVAGQQVNVRMLSMTTIEFSRVFFCHGGPFYS
jgi:hypothetical protein